MLTADVIQGFVGSVLASRFDESVKSPEFHKELWELACSEHSHVAIAAPRAHAKSTAGTLAYGLAALLFREARYLLIVSDTESQATMFVSAMKQELSENQHLIELFGIKKNEKGVVFLKETESDLIVELNDGHVFRIMGKGAQQSLRGILWNSLRPDLVIIDDLENDELVMNKERRDKLKRWFRAALLPGTSRKGKVRMWGTILHSDSLLENLMPQVSDKWTREGPLKVWSENPRKTFWKSIKYRAHNKDFSEILWPERYDKNYFKLKQEEYAQAGYPDLYSQEYLNEPIDESISYFKKSDFLAITDEDKEKNLRYYITADSALSESTQADYTVFLVAGVDDERIIHVRFVIRERMDSRTFLDTLFRLHEAYNPEAIGIEDTLITKAIGPFMKEEMQQRNLYPVIIPMKHGGKDKVQRARSIQGRMRIKTVKFDKKADWYPAFEDELLKFPRFGKDDQVDALAYLGLLLDKVVEAPTKEELEEEEYLAELPNESHGRSSWTGY